MRAAPIISYAQRFEDCYLMRGFGNRSEGFYIDIGSGHPVYDNASFAFYLKGWRGVTVEPNPWLARLSRAVRPRDCHVESLVGSRVGDATFYLVEEFHGLSTIIESHAALASARFGKASRPLTVPMTTLAALCERHVPCAVDFLKVDVEGAEEDVLLNGDWCKYRPKVVVAEALAPYTLTPAWEQWGAMLEEHGYRYAWFDSLNRYYVSAEADELAQCFGPDIEAVEATLQFRSIKPAACDPTHPDHQLAKLLAGTSMVQLPLVKPDVLCGILNADLPPGTLDRPAAAGDVAQAITRVLGPDVDLPAKGIALPRAPCLREVYFAIFQSDEFRAACGRISASYAW
ncbi:MAG TPA: FkbM family methyltransferase [Xanthobacteraceae bacterium]|jgi:FkbM family methyltransferase